MAYTAEERETTIVYGDLDTVATVYTCNRVLMNKLAKLEEEHPEDFNKIDEVEGSSVTYEVSKNLITIRAPRRANKVKLTPEQKEARRQAFIERMAKAREARKNGNKN